MNISSTTTIDKLRVSNQLNTNSEAMSKALFQKLDTENKGYLAESDIVNSLSAGNNFNVHDIFASIDTDSDQKISQTELDTRVKSLASELNTQLDNLRITFSKEILGNSDSKISSNNDAELIKQLETQDQDADLNHDGVVTLKEKVQYEQQTELASLEQTKLSLLNTYAPATNTSFSLKA